MNWDHLDKTGMSEKNKILALEGVVKKLTTNINIEMLRIAPPNKINLRSKREPWRGDKEVLEQMNRMKVI